jgi:putative transposase
MLGMAPLCSRRHRFPPEIIQYAIWLYLQLYPELHRDVEELLAERGLDISYETALGAKVRPPDRTTAAPASPWAERSLTIDHVLGAANYRSLRDDEPPMRPGIVGMQWI